MKRCTYCGRRSYDSVESCPGCGRQDSFRPGVQLYGNTATEGAHAPDPVDQVVACDRCGKPHRIPFGMAASQFACAHCREPLSRGPTPPEPKATPAQRRTLVMASLCAGVLLLVAFGIETIRSNRLEARLAAQVAAAQAAHAREVQEEEAALARSDAEEEAQFRKRLEDPRFLSGDLAYERHELEWAKRYQHEAGFAVSPLEQNLVKMQQLGSDRALTARRALEEVARLASPPGSRVEVQPSGDQFSIRVAFKMSTVSSNESGAVTKHHTPASMRREVAEICANLARELFDYCGSRGIERVQVSCNHALRRSPAPPDATPAERDELVRRAPVRMSCIYRAVIDAEAARTVTDWRRVPLYEVIGLFRVERDSMKTLRITSGSENSERGVDPNTPLEF